MRFPSTEENSVYLQRTKTITTDAITAKKNCNEFAIRNVTINYTVSMKRNLLLASLESLVTSNQVN